MLIHEACKICRLTKKAIEYYEEQQLIQPHILNNGYRDFSDYEIEQLKKIAIMRKLELSISDIRQVLNDDTTTALYEISMKKAFKIDEMKAKQELTQQLIQQQDWEYTRLQLEFLEQKQTISQRLRNVFPGPYGNYVSLHFASYLQEPITSQIQQDAFEIIVSFLDSCNFTISLELQEYLNEVSEHFDSQFVASISDHVKQAVQNPEQYISDNQKILKEYMLFKQSDEYKESPAYKVQEQLKAFNQESGYNDVFIPAMKKLSPAYQKYHESLNQLNDVFLKTHLNDQIE